MRLRGRLSCSINFDNIMHLILFGSALCYLAPSSLYKPCSRTLHCAQSSKSPSRLHDGPIKGGPAGFQAASEGVGAAVERGVSVNDEAGYKDGGPDWMPVRVELSLD